MKVKKVLFVSFSALMFALMLVVMELNKNTVLRKVYQAEAFAGCQKIIDILYTDMLL